MARAIRVTRWMVGMMALAAVGCSDQKTDEAIPQAGIGAEDEIGRLQDQLAAAQRDRAAAQDEALRLRNELEKLQSAGAGAGESWTSVPGGMMIAIDGTVLFDSGKAKLRPAGKTELTRVARDIRERFADHDIYVFGHTDNEPIKVSGWKDNDELSCQRALSVKRHLMSQGISAAQIASCGWGEYRPTASNTTTSDRQGNRRVEIFAVAKTAGGQRVATP